MAKKKMNRKTRAIISGLGIGLASIYAIASHFNIKMSTLNGFLISTLLFFAAIVLLAAVAVTVFKLAGKLLGRGAQSPDAKDRE